MTPRVLNRCSKHRVFFRPTWISFSTTSSSPSNPASNPASKPASKPPSNPASKPPSNPASKSNSNIQIVSTKKYIFIHPINRYILDWEISDPSCMRTEVTESLMRLSQTQIIHDHDTESLVIPNMLPEIYESLLTYEPDQQWYERPSLGPIIHVDLWLIPPSVLSMLMAQKRDSDHVSHHRVRVFLP
jgi:hypothetical protein